MYTVEYKNNNAYLKINDSFDLVKTLDCGQAFRWQIENKSATGVAFGKFLKIEEIDNQIIFYNTTPEDFENIWCDYFDLNRSYNEINEKISVNEILKNASVYGGGIRVLNQEPWETLCSFIISQNNNIQRIKGIVARLCENFGEDMGGYYTFPTAEKIASLSLEDLSVIRSGFRAKYILDAAKKIANNEIDLLSLKDLDLDTARNELMKIKGVGPKVADCALLFSHRFISALPKDVWIKRALLVLFGGELPEEAREYAGIVQQYIFYYARETKLGI